MRIFYLIVAILFFIIPSSGQPSDDDNKIFLNTLDYNRIEKAASESR